jgi:hypothetical protein
MDKLSCSFTLGKVSAGNANIEHNHRDFISANVDPARIADNIVYARENVRTVYDELFADSLTEYNAKQKRSDRKIADYFEHISQGGREEAYYEIIVQFGDADTAKVGTLDGKFATQLLDEYVRSFEKRNPNLRVFSTIIHLDETTPHAHINFVPFYTEQKKIGMSKGVSLKSALIEQGFSPQGMKQNQLVMWEQSEMAVMEDILNGRGLERDVKGATHAHKSVPEFKANQDWRKLPKRKKNMSTWEVLDNDLRVTRQKNSVLQSENDKLTSERNSPYKLFYFSEPDKHIFVQNRLAELGIPFRENEQGFEARQCYVEQIRQIEKQYKSTPISHRDVLRDLLDKIAMQVDSYDEILVTLKRHGYEVKHGKYTAVRPPNGDRFIRIKSLGEFYNEQAIRNRIDNRHIYENQLEDRLKSLAENGKLDSLEYRGQFAVKQYIVLFKQDLLPARKKKKQFVFSWRNDEQLDRLAALNRKINEGVTVVSLRNEMARLERSITDLENSLERFLATNTNPYDDTADDIRAMISDDRAKLKSTSETLNHFERLASMTWVDFLVNLEAERRQAERIGNGVKSADSSTDELNRVGEVAEKVVKAVEQKIAEPVEQQSYRSFKRR